MHGLYVIKWVQSRISYKLALNSAVGTAITDDDGVIAIGVIFDNFIIESKNIEVSVAVGNKKAITKLAIKTLFDIAFNHIGVERITCYNETSNTKSVRMAEMLGFKKEGVMRKASYNREDLNIYGMLKSECKWI